MRILVTLAGLLIAFILPQPIQGQLLSVSGYVKDHLSGQAIRNVSVYESISGIGTISNEDGYFRLLLTRGEQNLKVTSAGYTPVTSAFTLEADTILSLELKPAYMPAPKMVAGNKKQKESAQSAKTDASRKKQK
jgi:uncharacterized protein (DUF2235 family)